MPELLKDRSLSSVFKGLRIVQIFLAYVFLVSGILINFLQLLTACFIWPFNRALYRKLNYYLATIIWGQLTCAYQWWSASDLILYIKPEDLQRLGKENSLWLGNHRYEVDWLLGWVITQRVGLAGGSKIIGKQSLRMLPVVGWCWYFTESIFLRRVWNRDRTVLERDIYRLVNDYPKDYHYPIFLSCEGTRFTEEKRLESMVVARQKGLPELKHHILPRTKGFVLVMKGIHKYITAVYDITIGFRTPQDPQLSQILVGRKCVAEVFIRRIPVSEIPYENEDKSAEFVHKLFQQKDEIFEYFVQHGTFEGAGNPEVVGLDRKKQDLVIEIICVLIIGLPSIYLSVQLFLYGTIFWQIIFVCIIMTVTFGVPLMIQTSVRSKHVCKTKTE